MSDTSTPFDPHAAIRARLEKITPDADKWFATEQRPSHDCYEGEYRIGAAKPGAYEEHLIGSIYEHPNADFIAHSPTDLAVLLEENTRLRAVASAIVEDASAGPPIVLCGAKRYQPVLLRLLDELYDALTAPTGEAADGK